jgi:hypothetical protein
MVPLKHCAGFVPTLYQNPSKSMEMVKVNRIEKQIDF